MPTKMECVTKTRSSVVQMLRPVTTTQRRPPTPTTASACSQQGARLALVHTDGSGTTVDNDADQDGVCDQDEILGCTDALGLQLRRNADHRHRQQPLHIHRRHLRQLHQWSGRRQ